jgi:hypothetical protein
MISRPILFSGPMVRALIAGTKTQTRRIVKPQPRPFVQHTPDRHPTLRTSPYIDAYCGEKKTTVNPRGMGSYWHWWSADHRPDPKPVARCPYGQPGDQLWVRERGVIDRSEGRFFAYHASPGVFKEATTGCVDERCSGQVQEQLGPGWKAVPSIHMPRWASRITLGITGVRVERLQEISDSDAYGEGVDPCVHNGFHTDQGTCSYRKLWEQINGPGSWDANPWVWVIEFRRVMP